RILLGRAKILRRQAGILLGRAKILRRQAGILLGRAKILPGGPGSHGGGLGHSWSVEIPTGAGLGPTEAGADPTEAGADPTEVASDPTWLRALPCPFSLLVEEGDHLAVQPLAMDDFDTDEGPHSGDDAGGDALTDATEATDSVPPSSIPMAMAVDDHP